MRLTFNACQQYMCSACASALSMCDSIQQIQFYQRAPIVSTLNMEFICVCLCHHLMQFCIYYKTHIYNHHCSSAHRWEQKQFQLTRKKLFCARKIFEEFNGGKERERARIDTSSLPHELYVHFVEDPIMLVYFVSFCFFCALICIWLESNRIFMIINNIHIHL